MQPMSMPSGVSDGWGTHPGRGSAAGRPGARRPAVEQVLSELGALSIAQDRLDQFAAEQLGLNRTDQRALDIIGRAGTIAPTPLARALGMSTGATSSVLDRLETAGYVHRAPDPQRRRGTAVRMTEGATARCSVIFGGVIAATTAHAESLPDTDLHVIAEFLSRHRATLERLTAGEDELPGPSAHQD